ncbi:M48 family metallopeptidase [Microbulbifer zhoushanensis]|uniref:M48 family metallopeptidase n=1 Tax=Microbulbifer zhoushanensis TaxID=2904254 RepID=UPI001F47EDB5|nr:SprT family zinc-dependent metalloprotease [Microbulbifer zhoushanensis]
MIDAGQYVFEEVPYRLVRSPRRKRLGLVLAGAGVEVRIPQRCAARHGHRFLQENIHWVRAQLLQARQRAAEIPRHRFAFGEAFPWLGGRLPLLRAARPAGAGIRDDAIYLYTRAREPDAQQLQAALQRLYQREALAQFQQRSAEVAARLGLRFSSVRVRRTRSKWGHCTLRGELQYNWLVCLAPVMVVDYLVAHEVCHLRHHNHSPDFWALVASVCPDYREQRRWLRDNGHRLVL